MSALYELGFRNPEFDNYRDLSLHEAEDTAREEYRQAVRDMGSSGYDLVWPDHVDDVSEWLHTLSDDEAMEHTEEAHERGVMAVVNHDFPHFWGNLVSRGEAKLPTSDTMFLRLEEED